MDGENDRHCLKSRRIGMHIPLTSRFPSGFKKALYKWPNAVYGHMIDHSIRSNFSERVLLPGVSWCYFGWCLTRWMGVAVKPINHSMGATGDLTTWFQCNSMLPNVTTLLYPMLQLGYPMLPNQKKLLWSSVRQPFKSSLSLSIRSHSNEDDVALFSLNGLSHTQFVPRRSLMIEMSKFPTEIASLRVELDGPPYYPRLLCLFSPLCRDLNLTLACNGRQLSD